MNTLLSVIGAVGGLTAFVLGLARLWAERRLRNADVEEKAAQASLATATAGGESVDAAQAAVALVRSEMEQQQERHKREIEALHREYEQRITVLRAEHDRQAGILRKQIEKLQAEVRELQRHDRERAPQEE